MLPVILFPIIFIGAAILAMMFLVAIFTQRIMRKLSVVIERLGILIEAIKKLQLPTSPSTAVAVSILLDGKKGQQMVQVSDSGKVTATLEIDDAKGNAVPGAQLDASPAPAWSLDDPSFGDLAPSADGLSCVFSPNGKLGGPVHMQLSFSLNGVAGNSVSDDIQVAVGAPATVKMILTPQ